MSEKTRPQSMIELAGWTGFFLGIMVGLLLGIWAHAGAVVG